MKQSKINNADVFFRLLEGRMSLEDRKRLNEEPVIERMIAEKWNMTTDGAKADKKQEERILRNILRVIAGKPKHRSASRLVTNLSLWVASVVLIIICGALSLLLFVNTRVSTNTYIVTAGRQTMDSLRLSDGTCVMLNAGSRLTYPERFDGDRRVVELSGQAFFSVMPDKARPFIVQTAQMDVKALGTSFEVFSFDGDEEVEVILLTGKIKVTPKGDFEKNSKDYTLIPDQRLSLRRGIVEIDTVDADTYSLWRLKKGLSFKNEKLSMIIPRLEKWYGQKIHCSKDVSDYYRFTFAVRNESLDLILDLMSRSEPALVYCLMPDGTYELKKKK